MIPGKIQGYWCYDNQIYSKKIVTSDTEVNLSYNKDHISDDNIKIGSHVTLCLT